LPRFSTGELEPSEAARVLKVNYKTLLNKITECALKPPTDSSPRSPERLTLRARTV